MAVVFKKTLRPNPLNREESKYYPQLLTLGKMVDEDLIVYQIKELSSLSKGDIQSVVTNLLDVVCTNLYSGHSVNFRNFGIFSLSAKTVGADSEKECTAKNIKSVKINFRPSKSIRPDVNATRGGDKINFIDLDTYLKNRQYITKNDNNDDDDGGFVDPIG